MNPAVKIDNLSNSSLYKKFSVLYVLMSLIPIILILYILYYFNAAPLLKEHVPLFNLTILLVVLLSLACYDLMKRSMLSLGKISKDAVKIAEGDYNKSLEESKEEETGLLASSFNKITAELRDKIAQLEASKNLLQEVFNKIGSAVSSGKGIENLLDLIIRTLVNGAEAGRGAIFIYDNEKNTLSMKAAFGMPKPVIDIYPEKEKSIAGNALHSKKIEYVFNSDNSYGAYFEFKHGLANDSIIVSPLIYKDKALGVIIVCDKAKRRPFANDDETLLVNISSQTAIAIENFSLNEDAEKTYLETITALAMAVEAKDPYSRGHIDRVSGYAQRLGREMGMDEETMKILKNGAVLHDVGKIGVRDDVLRKNAPLNEDEQNEMRQHVIIGVNIIKPIRSMSALCDLVRYHQEFYDGNGYPDGLKGEQIPLTARMIKVCDAYDAMTTDRSYRKGLSRDEARKELALKSGSEFDPKVVESFLKII